MTQVSEVMTRGVRTLAPQDSIVSAARAMDELDVGVIPVCEGDRVVGLVTDRDLVVRAIARGQAAADTPLLAVMSRNPRCCFEDEPLDAVLEQMRDARIRRLPVLDHAQRLVGMLSLGDVAAKADGDGAGIVFEEISAPAAPDAAAAPAVAGGVSIGSDAHDGRGDDGVAAGDPRRNDGGGREGRPANARWADRGVARRSGGEDAPGCSSPTRPWRASCGGPRAAASSRTSRRSPTRRRTRKRGRLPARCSRAPRRRGGRGGGRGGNAPHRRAERERHPSPRAISCTRSPGVRAPRRRASRRRLAAEAVRRAAHRRRAALSRPAAQGARCARQRRGQRRSSTRT